MMKILFTFPGQGAQRPNMLAAIPDREAILRRAPCWGMKSRLSIAPMR
jgi:malonyl CoA-acyl carrier protein transacylase